MLAQRLADALHDAAMDLAVDDHWVDGATDIVDRGVAHQLDGPGLGVDLDLADVATVWEGGKIDRLITLTAERPAQVVGEIVALQDLGRDLEDAERTVGALDRKTSVGEFEITGIGLQRMARDPEAPGNYLARRVQHSRCWPDATPGLNASRRRPIHDRCRR
jgi:hypothetical protein